MAKGFNLKKFILNRDEVGRLLKGPEVKSVLLQAAQGISNNAGEGYKAVVMPTRVIVVPETPEAEKDNLENNTLLKARGHK